MSKFPILKNTSYSTSPSLPELHSLPFESLSSISFSIQNQHGSIEFLSKVDLRGAVLDDIISIQKHSVMVYQKSPPEGQGLNVKSRITLNTLDLTPSQIKSQCESMGATLITHDRQTRKTVFEVPHFTRYLFRDETSDESEEEPQVHNEIDVESDFNLTRQIDLPRQIDSPHQAKHLRFETQNLDFSRRFKFSISPQGLVYLPGASGNLKAYQLDFDNEQAVSGLEIQMNKILNSSTSSLCTTTHLENIWFDIGKLYTDDKSFDGISSAAQVWTLVSVLFGSPHTDVTKMLTRTVPSKEELFNDYQIQILRKKAFMTWIKNWCEQDIAGSDIGTIILKNLANGNIGLAAKEAIKLGHPRLAGLISLTPTEFTKAEISHQIGLWKQSNVFRTFQPGIALVYEVLSGNVEKLPDYLDWRQRLSLVIQYSSLSYNTLDQVFSYFFQSHEKNLMFSCEFNKDHRDICYYLMKFYSSPSMSFKPEWLSPFTYQRHFSLGTSWLLFFSLYSLFEVSADYKSQQSDLVKSAFDNLQFLTESYAEELVNSGRWKLALYVLKYSKNNSNFLKKIISKNCWIEDLPIDSTHTEEYNQTIEAGRALHDRNLFKFENSFEVYVKAKLPIQASELVVQEIAPLCIIKYQGETLYTKLFKEVLENIKRISDENNSIILEEEIYIEYLSLSRHLEQKWKPETDKELANTLALIDKLNIKILRLPRSTFHQQAAVSIMQKNLNSWKISLFSLQDKLKGTISIESLNSISICQTEDILGFCENLGYRYLKSLSKLS